MSSKDFYNRSDVFRRCSSCGSDHPVFYVEYNGGSTHLAMACPKSRPKTRLVKFEPNLDVPIFPSHKKNKEDQKIARKGTPLPI